MSAPYEAYLKEILIDEDAIKARLIALGKQISEDYADVEDLLLICVLKGGVVFLTDLMRHITTPHAVDFMAASSYGVGARETTGAVRIDMDVTSSIAGRHVLIVEDDEDVALAYQMMLRTSGYRVSLASSMYEVENIVASGLPHAVVVDIHMQHGGKDYTGLKVMDMVRDCATEFGREIPMIVVSGSLDEHNRQQVVGAGAHLFLPKPVRVDELAVRIGMLLQQVGETSPHR
ncbi:MAG: response regulator [Chloroflexota bacterium]